MGIRFACHACAKPLNIKQELAGKRGICPACRCRFRIPLRDAATSRPVEAAKRQLVGAGTTSERLNSGSASIGSPENSQRFEKHPGSREERSHPDDQSVMADQRLEEIAQPTDESPVSSLDLLSSDPESTWYVRPPTGGQYGPANGEMLREWIDEGRVATTSLLWRDGWPQWREACDAFPELAQSLPEGGDAFGYGDPSPTDDDAVSIDSGRVTEFNATPPTDETHSFVGSERIGATRRSKSMRRSLAILGLASVAVVLMVVLVVVASR